MKVKLLSLLLVAGCVVSPLMANGEGAAAPKKCPLRCAWNKTKEYKKTSSLILAAAVIAALHNKSTWFKDNVSARVLALIGLAQDKIEDAVEEYTGKDKTAQTRSPQAYRKIAKNK